MPKEVANLENILKIYFFGFETTSKNINVCLSFSLYVHISDEMFACLSVCVFDVSVDSLAPIEEGTCIFVFLHILHEIEHFISFSMFCCFLCLLNTKQANFKLFEFVFKRKVTTTDYFARLFDSMSLSAFCSSAD